MQADSLIGYIELARMKVDFPVACTDKSDDEIEGAIAWAENIINMATGDYFAELEQVLVVDGTGTEALYFYPYIKYRCLDITSVVDVDTETEYSSDCYIVRDYYMIMRKTPELRVGYIESPVWPEGVGNIKITGKWGWSETPDLITRAAGLLAAAVLTAGSEEQSVISSERYSGEKIGSYSYTVKRDIETSVDTTGRTGIDEVDSILENYTAEGAVFMFGV